MTGRPRTIAQPKQSAQTLLTAPVMTTVFPEALSSGLAGDMAAYVSLRQVGVAEGNGGCMMERLSMGCEPCALFGSRFANLVYTSLFSPSENQGRELAFRIELYVFAWSRGKNNLTCTATTRSHQSASMQVSTATQHQKRAVQIYA